MGKIDPRLEQLMAARAAGGDPQSSAGRDDLVHVYVETVDGNFTALAAAGFDVSSELAGSAIVILPVSRIAELADRDEVLAIYAPPVGNPQATAFTVDQQAVELKQAFDVKSSAHPSGSRGAGVVVGIVDSGVNVMHEAFRTAPPDRNTRIAFYWAQDDTITSSTGPLWDRMGKVYSAADIDTLITANPSGRGMPNGLMDPSGHGTGVASVAAGSAWPSNPAARRHQIGVAPEAILIVVGGQVDNQAGIEFCLDKADALNPARPCVVNLSLGNNLLPHNGRSVFDKRINALLTAKAGRALVVAAGNEGASVEHARVDIPHPGSRTLDIEVGPEKMSLELTISGSGSGGIKAAIAPPLLGRAAARTFFGDGDKHVVNGADRHAFVIGAATGVSAGDTDWHTSVVVNPLGDISDKRNWFVNPGTWQLRLETISESQTVVHIWAARPKNSKILPPAGVTPAKEEALRKDKSIPPRPQEWIEHTLRSEACGSDAIVVGGALVSRRDKTFVAPERHSSRGPNTDPTIPVASWKPDLVAPGENIEVARWTPPRSASDRGVSTTTLMSGTSISAPMVTGTVALMLSHDKTLKHADIRKHLRLSAKLMMHPKVLEWTMKYGIGDATMVGDGLLNIRGAQEQVSDLP